MTLRLGCVLTAVVLALSAGCNAGLHWLSAEDGNQVVKAQSGDRFYLTLDENRSVGERWSAVSDDADVTVSLDHREGCAKVELRVHRGFDGPSVVTFTCRRQKGLPPRQFTVSLYKLTGDRAFWE